MRANILGIDHGVILVRDIDAAQASFSRLGFTLTPRGFHSIGTSNHCLMFGSDYLELLAVTQPHPVTAYFSGFLADSEGLAAIAFSSDDAESAHRSLQASGIDADTPVDFSRPVELADGVQDARFRIVQLPVDAAPGCRTFLCQHFTPEWVWRPEYQQHPIGVVAIAGISVVVNDVPKAVDAYGRILGISHDATVQDRELQVGSVSLAFSDRSALLARLAPATVSTRAAPLLGALHLRVRDRAATADALRRGGFDATRLADGRLAVSADQAHGVALVFE